MAHILITSGPTREYLDPVRFLSNASSGRMGAALATACLRLGHQVTIVSGPVPITYAESARVVDVVSTDEMLTASLTVLPNCDGVIAVAAPCDFRPRNYSVQKIKKQPDQDGMMLDLVKTPDILSQLTVAKPEAWYVGFALETETGLSNAVTKLRQKRCDAIVLNQPETIGSHDAAVRLIDKSDQCVATYHGTKTIVAQSIVDWIQTRLIIGSKGTR